MFLFSSLSGAVPVIVDIFFGELAMLTSGVNFMASIKKQ